MLAVCQLLKKSHNYLLISKLKHLKYIKKSNEAKIH